MKKRPKKQTSDDRARDLLWLDPEPEHGCQISRKKLLCGRPTFVIIWGQNGGVSICLVCWLRLMSVAADGHVDTLELRRKYVARPTPVRRRITGSSESPGSEDRLPAKRRRPAPESEASADRLQRGRKRTAAKKDTRAA